MPAASGVFEIGRDGPGVLVVGLDDSGTSRDALAYAVGMGRREGSEVVIVAVSPPVTPAAAAAAVGGAVLPAGGDPGPEPLDAVLISSLDELVPGRWRLEQRQGEPAAEIEEIAKSCRADAIVVGRSRNPGRHLLGSVAGRLVRHAQYPVIVVP
jgi:nucleotide-binding universal stress UspA family protein